jgi:class 3 adenylate cyclase/TolB-like protein/cytochrome c-type biogenesis protein CcmH/NrfG
MDDVHLKRRLTAILLADVVGYSRLMSADEEGTHLRLADYAQNLLDPAVAKYRGRLIRSMGDGMLVEFDSALDAVRCGIEIQRGSAEHETQETNRRIQLRIGINTGDVIVDERDIYGNSINIAARLEGLAEPGQIYVTRGVRDQLLGYPNLSFEDKGERRVKNIDRPIRVYRVEHDSEARPKSAPRGLTALGRRMTRAAFPIKARSTSLIGAALLAILTILGVAAPTEWFKSPPVPPGASIVVMPFNNFSGDPKQEYLADAVTDDLTTDLSRLSGTLVIASGTAFTYKGKPFDPRQVGHECGVRYILEGSIERTGNWVQTNARLVETASATQIWADRFESKFSDLSELQDDITGRIASSLQLQLIKAEYHRAVAERPADPDATDLRLHAMALLLSPITREHHLVARRYLEESLRLDPQSAEGWGQLAHLLMNDYYSRWVADGETLPDLLRKAEEAVQNALRIDPAIAIAHQADGLVRRAHGDHLAALDAFDQALQLDPDFARAWAQKANELVMVGRPKEALPFALRAITLSPRDPAVPVFYWIIGRAYFVMQKYDDAIVWLRKSVELRGNAWYTRAYLLSAYALTGRVNEPEGLAARRDFATKFGDYTVHRIRDVYVHENPQSDPGMQESVRELSKGLLLAGVPEH